MAKAGADLHENLGGFGALAEEVQRLQAVQNHKFRLWALDKFMAKSESNSKYYLKKFKAKTVHGRIHSLKCDDGTMLTSQSDIILEVHRFFSQVYAKPLESDDFCREREKLLQVLQSVVSDVHSKLLTKVPSLKEFSDTLAHLPRGKASGIDEFFYDALTELWRLTGEDFTSMIQGCWMVASFPATISEGVIKLIPKELELVSLLEWRPIALLNSHYKLIAKIIADRLAIILPMIVPIQQQGFIRGRSVHGCIINFLLAHGHMKKTRRRGAFLMVDLEKAYNRLSLDFLWAVLDRLGFGSDFINILKALSKDASAGVQVNACLSPDFSINRGVRHRCPLAPLLFAISSIPFILSVQKETSEGKRKTRMLSGGLTLDVAVLADDTAVFLEFDESSFQHLFLLLNSFQSAAGAKLSYAISLLSLRRLFRSFLWGFSSAGVALLASNGFLSPKEVAVARSWGLCGLLWSRPSLPQGTLWVRIVCYLTGSGMFSRALGMRMCWKRRCNLLFDGSVRALSWGSAIISVADIILAEEACASRKKEALMEAMHAISPALPTSARSYLDRVHKIFS
ncbi:hypothetical protein R1sor_009038 [Riccia sorocarpa]|uniref:Reverse transcriptase domain-containing protein n=1 Tax=Riccia sorocarpa TaxID=122646 RepID=A0ABD3HAN3_9MARC